jgi:hypothetical protein
MRSRPQRRGESFVPIAGPLAGGRRGSRKRLDRIKVRDHTSIAVWILLALMFLTLVYAVMSQATHSHHRTRVGEDSPR